MRFPTTALMKMASHHLPTTSQYHHFLDQITSLKQVHQLHAHITTSGFQHNQFLVRKLIEISGIKFNKKPNSMAYPMQIFTHSQPHDQFTWNIIIRGFSISHTPHNALHMFVEMLRESIQPQSFTFAFLLKGCARGNDLVSGKTVHSVVFKTGYDSDLYVANTLIHFYAFCGDLGSAEKVFDEMSSRENVVTWNAVISGYVQNGLPDDGLRVFDLMKLEGVRPDDVTMISVISACGQKKDLEMGRWANSYVDVNWDEFESNVRVGSSLVDMYGKCKQMALARQVFQRMRRKDIAVWNALINGYVNNGSFKEALDLYKEVKCNGLDPDESTLVSVSCACGQVGAVDIGKKIHSYAEERGFMSNAALATALVDMYSKCGCISEAREIFDKIKMADRNVMTWTSMIGGLALHGRGQESLDLFTLMLKIGPRPDGITFVGVLSACSHAGLVDQGLFYYKSMIRDYNITPRIEHYGCMIDLLGRAGRLEEAHEIISSMEIQANSIVWRAFLSACSLHSNVELAESAVDNLFKMQSDTGGDYVLLSNLYATKGRWDDVKNVRIKMEKRRIMKMPGLSLVETNSKLGMHA